MGVLKLEPDNCWVCITDPDSLKLPHHLAISCQSLDTAPGFPLRGPLRVLQKRPQRDIGTYEGYIGSLLGFEVVQGISSRASRLGLYFFTLI